MNKFFYRSSYNEYKNGNLIDNSEENIDFENNKGKYTQSKFGKIKKEKNINKKDIDNYIRSVQPNLYITDTIFNDALAIINNSPYNLISPIYLGNENKPNNKNLISNHLQKGERSNSKCSLINKKYKLPNKNSKEQMRKIYKERALKTHPDKCKSKQCDNDFKELNKDYHFYFDKNNNC